MPIDNYKNGALKTLTTKKDCEDKFHDISTSFQPVLTVQIKQMEELPP